VIDGHCGSIIKKIGIILIQRCGTISDCKRTVGRPRYRCDNKIALEDIRWGNLYLTHLAQRETGDEIL
jgi:hypothetical protein